MWGLYNNSQLFHLDGYVVQGIDICLGCWDALLWMLDVHLLKRNAALGTEDYRRTAFWDQNASTEIRLALKKTLLCCFQGGPASLSSLPVFSCIVDNKKASRRRGWWSIGGKRTGATWERGTSCPTWRGANLRLIRGIKRLRWLLRLTRSGWD